MDQSSDFDDQCDLKLTFWEHLEALRGTIIKILCTVIIGITISFFFYSTVLEWVISPLEVLQSGLETYSVKQQHIVNTTSHSVSFSFPTANYSYIDSSPDVIHLSASTFTLPKGSFIDVSIASKNTFLALLDPLEGMQTTLKICFWLGLVATSPFWLFFLAQFILPALQTHEKKLCLPFIFFSILFFLTGCLFAYKITLPIANDMLYTFNEEIGTNLWSFKYYISYTLLLLLANGLAFEMAFLLFFFVRIGLLKAEAMRSKRRPMILFSFILSALLTPPDILTQFLLAIPLCGLYELAILYARFQEKLSRREVIA